MTTRSDPFRSFAALVAVVAASALWAREYPYPFLDLAAHDLPVVLRNCPGVFALFLMLGAVLVLVDRWRGRVPGVVAGT